MNKSFLLLLVLTCLLSNGCVNTFQVVYKNSGQQMVGFTKYKNNDFDFLSKDVSNAYFSIIDDDGKVQLSKVLPNFLMPTAILYNSGDDVFVLVGHQTVYKLNTAGQILYQRNFVPDINAGFNDIRFKDITMTSSGDYLLTGYGNHITKSENLIAMKLDSNGDTIWFKYYNFPSNDYGRSYGKEIFQRANGSISICGEVIENSGNSFDALVVHLNSGGSVVCCPLITGSSSFKDEYTNSIDCQSGDCYVSGTTDNRLFFFKIDPSNNQQIWSKQYNASNNVTATSFVIDAFNRMVFTGHTTGTAKDLFAGAIDLNGNLMWMKYYDTGQEEMLITHHNQMAPVEADNSAFLFPGSSKGDTNGSAFEPYLVKTSLDGKNCDENIWTATNVAISPYPHSAQLVAETFVHNNIKVTSPLISSNNSQRKVLCIDHFLAGNPGQID